MDEEIEDVAEPLEDSVDKEIEDVAEPLDDSLDEEIDCPDSPVDQRKLKVFNHDTEQIRGSVFFWYRLSSDK